jgi:CheY-like chemotaxis protein
MGSTSGRLYIPYPIILPQRLPSSAPRLKGLAVQPFVRHVLVVEDNDDLRDSLIEILRSEGAAAEGAKTGLEALGKLRSGLRPSLILLDLRMDGMSGWDFRVEQKKDPELTDIPVVAMTGGLWKKQDVYDFTACISKPVLRGDLRSQLRLHCRAAPPASA